MRIPYDELFGTFYHILLKHGFNEDRALQCAHVFANNSRDGVYSHGLNRFPVFIEYVKLGLVDPLADPTPINSFGAIEQWDGNLAPGMLNASFCMDRAITLAANNGIGCVAIKNTNHWMRGGTYGLQAAEAGYIGLCFTNTIANLPPWGGTVPRLGNNPLIIAIPRPNGPIVLDMAMSQYAMGKLQQYKMNDKPLTQPGGYDEAGNLSTDAGAILSSGRALPIGFWKGSGLSMVLDILATILSGGQSTAAITQAGRKESGVSQVFIAIKTDNERNNGLIEDILSYTKSGDQEADILYPGEQMMRTREQSMREGVWADEEVWKKISAM